MAPDLTIIDYELHPHIIVALGTGARVALLTTTVVFLALQRRGAAIEVLFLGGLVLVTLFGVLKPADAVAGFSSKAVLTIGALFVAAATALIVAVVADTMVDLPQK